MTAAQKTVDDVMPIGVAGQIADLFTDEFGKTESLINRDTLSVGFGLLVKYDGVGGLLPFAGASDVLAGVTMFERLYDFPSERDDIGVLPGLPMGTLKKGNILVFSQTAVTAETGEVHVWHGTEDRTADPPILKGQFRGTASAGNTTKIDLKGARWKTTLAGAGIAELEIDLPQGTLSALSADT